MRQPPLTSLLSGNSLPLALGGSALLHLGLLFGLQADVPGSGHAAQPMTVRLATASAAPAAVTAPAMPEPPAARPQPPRPAPARQAARAQEAEPAAAPAPAVATQATPAPVMQAALAPAAPNSEPAISTNTYYEDGQLDTPPRLLGVVQQVYPGRARAADIEGSVTLTLLIDEQGRVTGVSVLDAEPRGYFEQAALDMLREQRFTPALIHNHPVKSRWRTTVRYRLQS